LTFVPNYPCYTIFDVMNHHKLLWDHAHALNVRVDLEGAVAVLDGMKNEAASAGR
jgi:hypothetical protein